MKNIGLFLNMSKRFFFWGGGGFMFLWFVSCVFGKVAKMLKCLFFSPAFWHFVGRFLLVYLGLEGFGVFFLFVVFVLVFCLDFVLFVLFLFCCWIVFGVVLVFVFGGLFCFFVFFFLGGGLFFLVFVCFVCLCWSVLVFYSCVFFKYVCLLDWSRCCSSFVSFGFVCVCFVFVCVCLCLFCVCLCLFLSVFCENHGFPCNFLVY